MKTFEKVEYILLDPPCTGSGMVNRLALVSSIEKDEDERLWNIGGVQIRMLIHAMTKFPNAIKIVYSTCSIHPNENEHVRLTYFSHFNFIFHRIDLSEENRNSPVIFIVMHLGICRLWHVHWKP